MKEMMPEKKKNILLFHWRSLSPNQLKMSKNSHKSRPFKSFSHLKTIIFSSVIFESPISLAFSTKLLQKVQNGHFKYIYFFTHKNIKCTTLKKSHRDKNESSFVSVKLPSEILALSYDTRSEIGKPKITAGNF